MEKLQGKSKKGKGAKYRREKRDAHRQQSEAEMQQQEAESGHPVIRTLYDHFEVIIHKNGVVKRVIYGVCCLCLHSVIHIIIILPKNNKTFTKMETMNTRFVFFVFH